MLNHRGGVVMAAIVRRASVDHIRIPMNPNIPGTTKIAQERLVRHVRKVNRRGDPVISIGQHMQVAAAEFRSSPRSTQVSLQNPIQAARSVSKESDALRNIASAYSCC